MVVMCTYPRNGTVICRWTKWRFANALAFTSPDLRSFAVQNRAATAGSPPDVMRAPGARVRRRPLRRWPSWPWQVIGGGIAALIALVLVAGGAGGAAEDVETKLVLAQDSQLVAAHQSWLLPLRDSRCSPSSKGPS